MRTVFEAEGQIRGTDLLAALVALWREGSNGALQFSRSGASAGFELAAGEIVGTSSSDPRFETAAILLRAGKLDDATLERLTASEGSDRAQTALRAGVLTKREWRWGEKIRAVEILSDLLTWVEGDYWLFRTGGRESGEFRLSIPRLVLELFLRSRDRGLVLHYLGGTDVALVRADHFESEFATIGLTQDAESVVRLIDGESTAAEIASQAPAEPFAVEKLLAALVTLGLVHPEYAPGEAAPPVPSTRYEEPEEEAELDAEAQGPEEEGEEGEEEEETEEEELVARQDTEPAEEELVPQAALPPEEEDDDLQDESDELEDRDLEPEPAISSEAPSLEFDETVAAPARRFDEGEDREEPAFSSLDASEPGNDERESRDLDVEPSMSADLLPVDSDPAAFDRPLDLSTGVGGGERPRQHSGATWLWVLLALAASVGALLLWRSRGGGAPVSTVAAAVPAATASPVEAPPTPSEALISPVAAVATPTAAPPVSPTRERPTRAAPTAAVRQPTAAPPLPVAAKVPADRQAWLDRAERDRGKAAADRRARYTIQLELACEVESLVDAWKHDRPAGSMWVLATPFRGKTCFRVLWGRYQTREGAARALAGAPAFFSTPRNRPVVVPIR
jgi:hypothetical protein